MRAMTRELHEAAQEARAAARELRAERAAEVAGAEAVAGALAARAIDEIDAHAARRTAELTELQQTIINGLNELYDSFLARLAELSDNELDQEGIKAFMTTAVLRACHTREFVARVVEAVAEEIAAEPSLCTPAARSMPGEVLVGTASDLAAFRRAGGDPGFVLNLRT
jgi:hypothetical protein